MGKKVFRTYSWLPFEMKENDAILMRIRQIKHQLITVRNYREEVILRFELTDLIFLLKTNGGASSSA